jgi:hypothetical protein
VCADEIYNAHVESNTAIVELAVVVLCSDFLDLRVRTGLICGPTFAGLSA